jgi:hypothetical protein
MIDTNCIKSCKRICRPKSSNNELQLLQLSCPPVGILFNHPILHLSLPLTYTPTSLSLSLSLFSPLLLGHYCTSMTPTHPPSLAKERSSSSSQQSYIPTTFQLPSSPSLSLSLHTSPHYTSSDDASRSANAIWQVQIGKRQAARDGV